jgi:hypothetical protein
MGCSVERELLDLLRLPYAGINRIRFEGLISGLQGHP